MRLARFDHLIDEFSHEKSVSFGRFTSSLA
jgi:hypothetical protein